MSFKINGNDVNEFEYYGNDVKLVRHNDNGTITNVWAKAYTLTIVSNNTGVSSVSVKRTASLLSEVATNVLLSNGATIYYGDTLQVTSTASNYYAIDGSNPTTITVSGNTTVSPTATRKTSTVTITVNSNVSSIDLVYYNSSGVQTTTTFSNSGSVIAQQGRWCLWNAYGNEGYTLSENGGGTTELTGDMTINPTATLNSYTISFAKGGSQYGSWGSASKTAYHFDVITRSGNTITCYQGNTSAVRWTNTFTNGSATGYTYSVSYSSVSSPVSSAQTITATTSRTANTYTISYAMGSNDAQHNGTYATSYTYSASSQTKSIGTATRSGYNGYVSTNVGSISGSTLTIPAGTTGTITITWSWVIANYTLTFIEDSGASYGSWQYSTVSVAPNTKLYYVFSNTKITDGNSKMYVKTGSTSGTTINTYTATTNSSNGSITQASTYYTIVAGTNTVSSPYTVTGNANIGVGVERGGGLCCFVGDTKITMADGTYKYIKDIVVGDRVLSYNIKLNELELDTTVVKGIIVKNNITTYADVLFDDGSSVTMNEYHPLYTQNGWHSITNYEGYDTLVVGDKVKTQNGWKTIIEINRYIQEPVLVYNLDVEHEPEDDEDIDNYFANDSLAHNKIIC